MQLFEHLFINFFIPPTGIPYSIKIKRHSKKSPTTAFYYEIANFIEDSLISEDSRIEISFSKHINYDNGLWLMDEEAKPFEIKNASPQPDQMNPYSISYSSKASITNIMRNQGFYIIIEDIIARNQASRYSLQYTVLIGAIIAFMLDIIVNLILKWRHCCPLKLSNNGDT